MDIFVPNRKLWTPHNKRICNLTPDMLAMLAGGESLITFHTKAVDFNGSDEQMFNTTDSNIGIANAFTVLMWFDPDTLSGNMVPFHIRNSSTQANQIFIRMSAINDIIMRLFDSSATQFKEYTTNDQSFTVDTKWQYGFTWNGTTLIIYINGANYMANVTKTIDDAGTMSSTNREVSIGATSFGAEFWDGTISRVDVWNTDLTASAITSLYANGVGYKHDTRNTFRGYTETANLKHQWALGLNVSPNIGEDFVSSGGINVETNATNISNADIVTF